MFLPNKVISGGQTGADIGGLHAAWQLGIVTGGEVPRDCRTENGKQPILIERYGCHESESMYYPIRTERNVVSGNATIIFSTKINSRGTKQTIHFSSIHKKPYTVINPYDEDAINIVREFLNKHKPEILNIAGNRESVSPGIAKQVLIVAYNSFLQQAGDSPLIMGALEPFF